MSAYNPLPSQLSCQSFPSRLSAQGLRSHFRLERITLGRPPSLTPDAPRFARAIRAPPSPPSASATFLQPSQAYTCQGHGLHLCNISSGSPVPFPGGLGRYRLWGHHGPWPTGVELYFAVATAEWEDRGGRRWGGLGRREQLSARFPWAAGATCLPALNLPGP